MNLYIESIEGGNYVVATGEPDSQQPLMVAEGKPRTFHCLNEIRTHFEGKSFSKVWLRQATPYEEMVGQTSQDTTLDMEIDW
ncbi:DUF6482 family protein [Alteromonas antoniana]|uniref:DUF6482 family protein n=1 Tax=Alteromonas antoniana TaxID=2803813 RepID=UPI001C45DA8D|nr:DUF6482 family protein [Alteromonas antoniana]